MMMPRLKLLRELLRDDGVIFISIDDNEVHHLRMLMDEIFDENNFIASIVWQKKYAVSSDAKGIPAMHDYILVYQKSSSFSPNLLPRTEKQDKVYQNPDDDPRGLWRPDNLTRSEYRERDCYPITSPKTGKVFYPPEGASWRHPKDVVEKMIADNRIWFGKNGNNRPVPKRFLSEVRQGIVAPAWWTHSEAGHNDQSKKELQKIFSGKSPFDTPKPTQLLERILRISTNKDSIILDSFAGSGTTAHAVLALNQKDEGSRRFILVEMEDYAKSLTAERVKRVIKGVPKAKDEALKNGLGGSFSFFELGDPVEMQAILEGDSLPAYEDLARYVFYTATGDEFDLAKVDQGRNFIGENREFEVYLLYQPDLNYLRSTALDLDKAEKLGLPEPNCKKRLVFAPMKYLDTDTLERYRIEYCQLPFEIYKFKE
jgi:adenine-specific DNA-methyltransferase